MATTSSTLPLSDLVKLLGRLNQLEQRIGELQSRIHGLRTSFQSANPRQVEPGEFELESHFGAELPRDQPLP